MQIKTTGCWWNFASKVMITWLVHRFAIGAEWKTVESGAEEKIRQNISNIFKKCSSVRVITFLRQVFKCFWSSTSSRNVIVVYICANVWLCGAEPRKTTGTAFFYGGLNSSQTFWKHFVRQVQVYDWSYNLTETSIQRKYLHLKLIENRNSCAHLQMFCCVVPREGNEHCRSYGFHRWTFATEVLADAEKQKSRHFKISSWEISSGSVSKTSYRQDLQAIGSWVFLR